MLPGLEAVQHMPSHRFPWWLQISCTNVSCFFILCWSSDGCGYVMILGAKRCSHILKFKSISFFLKKNCKTNSWIIIGRQSHYQPWEMKAKNERNYLSLFLRLFTIWRLTLEGPRSLSTIKSKSPTGVQIVKKYQQEEDSLDYVCSDRIRLCPTSYIIRNNKVIFMLRRWRKNALVLQAGKLIWH